MERWLPVVGYENLYEVSNFGRVRSALKGHLKIATRSKDGRLLMLLWKNNRPQCIKIHRLVLLAFLGKPPAGCEGCHNDGNPANNHLDNLRWDTAQANQQDRVKHGTSNRGEQCGTSKLTEKDVLAIRADSRKQKEIAAAYGVRESQISRIKNRVRWGHL